MRLTDSPISRAGYWWATLVGFTWGFLWSTGRIERRQGLVVFTGMPKWTFGRGGSCVGGCYLTDRNAGDVVLGHEAVHKAQWRTYGMLFPLLYWLVAGAIRCGTASRSRPASRPAATCADSPGAERARAATRHPRDRSGLRDPRLRGRLGRRGERGDELVEPVGQRERRGRRDGGDELGADDLRDLPARDRGDDA